MSDLAASGGYYIALAGDEIVAQPGTLTGSIGIYTGKFVYGGTLNKVGVTAEAVLQGANADIYSPLARFTPAQREKVRAFMQDFYTGFLDKTAAARNKTRDEVHALAQGRVWTGAQAKERGLVDRLGGLETALAAVKERAGLRPDEAVETVVYPRRRTFYEALSDQFSGARRRQPGAGARRRARPCARDRVGHRARPPVPPRRAARADAVCVREVEPCRLSSGLKARTRPAVPGALCLRV